MNNIRNILEIFIISLVFLSNCGGSKIDYLTSNNIKKNDYLGSYFYISKKKYEELRTKKVNEYSSKLNNIRQVNIWKKNFEEFNTQFRNKTLWIIFFCRFNKSCENL